MEATQETVDHFNKMAIALCEEAEKAGVVVEIELLPTLPLKMGGYVMAPRARAAVNYNGGAKV